MQTDIQVKDENGGLGMELVQYEDVLMPKFYVAQNMNGSVAGKLSDMKHMAYRDGDILTCSFPKSGTHWLTNLVSLLLYKGPIEGSPSYTPMFIDLYTTDEIESLPSPRVLHMHSKLDRAPTEFIKRAKFIMILRNPKDAAVSLYCHLKNARELSITQSWDHFVRTFLSGHVVFGPYTGYLLSLQKELQENKNIDIHLMYYEDLKKDAFHEMQRLQRFLGLSHSDERLQAILDRCSMKKLRDDINEGRTPSLVRDINGMSLLYRKGEIGDWKNHFTVAQNEVFDEEWEALMKDSMFHFQYT